MIKHLIHSPFSEKRQTFLIPTSHLLLVFNVCDISEYVVQGFFFFPLAVYRPNDHLIEPTLVNKNSDYLQPRFLSDVIMVMKLRSNNWGSFLFNYTWHSSRHFLCIEPIKHPTYFTPSSLWSCSYFSDDLQYSGYYLNATMTLLIFRGHCNYLCAFHYCIYMLVCSLKRGQHWN